MKRHILIVIAGVLLPLVVNGQTTTFVTTVGSPNGVFSALEVKGVELRGNDACGRADATCSATVAKVDTLNFLTRTPNDGTTGMIYLPVSMSGDEATSRPANLGRVEFTSANASLAGDVRTVGTSPAAGAIAANQFNSVEVHPNTQFSVRSVTNASPVAAGNINLTFTAAGVDFSPLLAVGVLTPMQFSRVNVSAMAVRQIWNAEDHLVFRERQFGDSVGINGSWQGCTGVSPSCTCGDGLNFHLEESCERYYLLRAN